MVKIIIGKEPDDGEFHVDLKEKKLIKTIVYDEDLFETNFPKISEEGYNFKTLEDVMKWYMLKDISLEEIVKDIKENGFFNPIKPSLWIYIVESEK